MLRLGVEALAGLESLAAAGGGGRRLAIGGAVLRHRATLARDHDARVRQSHDRVGRILGGVAGLLAELIEGRLRALQVGLESGRASLSQWPIVSTKPGRKTESGAGAAGGLAAGSPGCWLGISPGGRTSCAGADVTRQSAPAASTARAMAAKERASSVSGWLVISIPSTSQPRAGWAGHVAKMRSGGTSKQIEGGNDAGDQHHRGDRCPEAQPFFDDGARLRAVAVEQERLDIKSHAARDDRQQHEQEQIVAGETRRNGHDLVGDRGEPLEQDDPAAPLHVSRTERVDLVAV